MVSFLLPRSHTLEIAECPKQLAVDRHEKEPNFHRTSPKSPDCVRHRADSEERSPKAAKSTSYNSWFKSIITSSFISGGNSPRPDECGSPSSLESPTTHVRRRTRSLVDSCKVFTSQAANVDPRLPAHMRRPELQLRRIQGRDQGDHPHSPKSPSKRSGSVERNQKSSI